jgi:pyruvate/2-oxoglutarate dehydrogenase complex dihydrolipoamide dehydrogenase (E3) component
MKTAPSAKLLPLDPYNKILIANVSPMDWDNPEPASQYDLVVIGAGTAGLVTAAGAAGLGAKVALVEKHLLGGDCLNVGCVPSKALLRSARVATDMRRIERYGLRGTGDFKVDFAAVMERMRRLRSEISAHDSVKRFRELGVDVFLGEASFSGADMVEVGGKTLRFHRAVIATGARAAGLPIEGLAEAGYLTNETVFSLTVCPPRLAVIGGGPLGCELAQAFQRLGSEVVLLQSGGHLLEREDRDAAEILQQTLVREGMQLLLGSRLRRITLTEQGKIIHYEQEGHQEQVVVDEILLGVGRAPNVEGLNLEAAGVNYDRTSGVAVNDHLQTSNLRIYAAGDICLPTKFTHMADAAARMVIQNALFGGRKKLSALTIPWCTYTDPEIAHVGLYERDAQVMGLFVDTFVRPLHGVDRAVLDGESEGFVKVHVRRGTDQILGATIVARHAGEMISELTVAMVGGMGLKTIAQVIHPYPTQAEAIRQVADAYNRSRLTPFVKRLLHWWFVWKR